MTMPSPTTDRGRYRIMETVPNVVVPGRGRSPRARNPCTQAFACPARAGVHGFRARPFGPSRNDEFYCNCKAIDPLYPTIPTPVSSATGEEQDMSRGRKPTGEGALAGAERMRRYRARHADGTPRIRYRRPADRRSRASAGATRSPSSSRCGRNTPPGSMRCRVSHNG
jgi:hypothetical protein